MVLVDVSAEDSEEWMSMDQAEEARPISFKDTNLHSSTHSNFIQISITLLYSTGIKYIQYSLNHEAKR